METPTRDAPADVQPAMGTEPRQTRRHPPLPLWTGNDLPAGRWEQRGDVLYEPTDGNAIWRVRTPAGRAPVTTDETEPHAPEEPTMNIAMPEDVFDEYGWGEPAELDDALAAFDDLVPDEQATRAEVQEVVAARARELDEAVDNAPMLPRAPAVPTDPEPGSLTTSENAAAVNAALDKVDEHADAFRDAPEWQRIQTVRGAVGHLWNVFKEKAGRYWDALREDVRFQGWWKSVAIRAASTIGRWANELADNLRQSTAGELPSADALMKLSETALTYSTPPSTGPQRSEQLERTTEQASGQEEKAVLPGESRPPAARSERTGAVLPYANREEALHATQRVGEAFREWAQTPMGKELGSSDHPRVDAFRQAWQRLPSERLESGPGPAAGPYGDAAVRAQALVEAAVASGRFAPGDVAALQAVATAAGSHGARLAVTLPGAAAQSPAVQAVAQAAPRVATAAPEPRRGPRASA
ncbi:hypothetical protein ACFVZW_19380 [Streptomyces sp. NPDC059567]|uniref:hypothetical protein n=1 Tax=Streptomyces sp. NPDC059567 TaxID=3346867 RepID=UPI0036AA0AB1